MNNNEISKSGENNTNNHRPFLTIYINKIKDLPTLYKLIDELKNGQKRFIDYNMLGDADG